MTGKELVRLWKRPSPPHPCYEGSSCAKPIGSLNKPLQVGMTQSLIPIQDGFGTKDEGFQGDGLVLILGPKPVEEFPVRQAVVIGQHLPPDEALNNESKQGDRLSLRR